YQVGGPAAQGAASLERGICSRPALSQQRQHVVTYVVAVKIGKPVGRIPDAVNAMFLQPVINVPTTPVQKRSVQPAAHNAAPARDDGQPGGAGAAQQSQDDGSGMIIGVMCSVQHIVVGHKPPKCLVAGIASF